MLTAIVFGAIFLTILGALASYTLSQNSLQNNATSKSRGLAIAEAGLEYYRWHLAHFASDLKNGTNSSGPYLIPYNDPEGGQTGTISLSITGNTSCGQVTSIDITSTGTPIEDSNAARTVVARYARPTVAQYSYVLNDSVWAGDDRIINGPYHSNGGVRMDGTANAPVTSSLTSWLCTSSFGCSPNSTKSGVFGSGPNSDLWSFPEPQVDFARIAADFSSLKSTAQAQGLYLPRYSSGNSNGAAYWKGYHLTFNANGTVTIRRVTSTTALSVVPINTADDTTDHALLKNETLYSTYTLPASCGLIYVEDNVWVEGTVPSKVTVVAANVVNNGIAPNAYISDNILYGAADGSDGLTLIAENNVLIAPDAPQNLILNGVFIAQDGAFGRNLYSCPSSYEPRTSLTILGTTVSNKRTGTKWVNGCGWSDAGYQTRIDAFDRKLSTDPPPFTPAVSVDYSFVDWREK